MSCPNSCQPGSYYLPSSPPTWAVGTDKNSYCAAALMGALPNEPCYSECASFPVPCYGYAMNVVTPKPWVYPGMRQSATMQDVNNCDDLILQTTKDGSIFAGKALPPSLQQGTHVMAGYAAGGEYHYARFDADTRQWSSKNGIDPPSQYDSKNQLITDASNAAEQIRIATRQQTSASEQIVAAISGVAAVSAQQAHGTAEAARAVAELDRLAGDLKRTAGVFTTA